MALKKQFETDSHGVFLDEYPSAAVVIMRKNKDVLNNPWWEEVIRYNNRETEAMDKALYDVLYHSIRQETKICGLENQINELKARPSAPITRELEE